METLISLIIIGIWGCICLIGMILVKLERTKAECWMSLSDCCDCEKESEEN